MGLYEFKPEDADRFATHVGIPAKKRGREMIFERCPYCKRYSNDKNTFSINLESGRFQCFRSSCGAKGNMITLAKDFGFSLGTVADGYYRQSRQYRDISSTTEPTTRPEAIRYMQTRGISKEVTRRYHLTVQKDRKNVLVFPFYDEMHKLQFVKYRRMDYDKARHSSKEWCEKDCRPILFGMNHCNPDNETLVITEGQIDSLSLAEAGIENAVSVPTGAKGFTWVPHCWDFLKKFKALVVFGDYENGHITLLDELAHRFDGMVKHVRYLDYLGCKDANEILLRHGKEALVRAVERAVPVEHPQILPLADVEKVDLSQMEKFSTGFPSLDRVLGGFYFGQLILLTGERGEGKSTLASQFATLAVCSGYNVYVYSGELMNWYFKAWFDRQVAGPDYINRKVSESGYTDYSVDGAVMPAMESWYREKVFIYDNDIVGRNNEHDTLLKVLETAIRQYECRVLIIDNLMTAMVDDTAVDQYRQQTNFVNALAQMAKQHNVLIFLVAHPRKKQGFGGFDSDDVLGSSTITNLVDVVIRYARPRGNDIPADTLDRELTVHKNRLTGITKRTGIPLFYDPASKRISEAENSFTWTLGWEKLDKDFGFRPWPDDLELPFE